jgi:arylsulfatase A-like enzyme
MRKWRGPWGRWLPAAMVAASTVGLLLIVTRVSATETGAPAPLAPAVAAAPTEVYFGPALPPTPPTPTRPKKISHVLIISEDGMRADAVTSLHLKWHDLLRKHGSYSDHALTIRDASTLPAHAAMLSGVDEKTHGLTWNNWHASRGYIKTPTIFSRAQEAGLSTAFFTGKSKLRHIVPPGSVGIYDRPGYYCKKVAEEAAAYLISEKPTLAFVHFSDPDEFGHSKGWMSQAQKAAIARSDRCLGMLYEALESSGLIEDTLIIVSADHGGHNHVHSGALKIDREIPWIACGPGVREDYNISEPLSTMDTAATALWALGLPVPPELQGKPRTDIFVPADDAAIERLLDDKSDSVGDSPKAE